MKNIEVFVCKVGELGTKLRELREKGYNVIDTRDKYTFDHEGWLMSIDKELYCVK